MPGYQAASPDLAQVKQLFIAWMHNQALPRGPNNKDCMGGSKGRVNQTLSLFLKGRRLEVRNKLRRKVGKFQTDNITY